MQRADGHLELSFQNAVPRTRCYVDAQRAPLRVLRGFPYGEQGSLVHLHNISGGTLAGDLLNTDVRIDDAAKVCLTTTGATRIYKSSAPSAVAVNKTSFRLGVGSSLEFLPDLCIPYENSRYRQETHYDLTRTSRLLCWDMLAPGRCGFEDDFSFEQFASITSIDVDGLPVFRERFDLRPRQDQVQIQSIMAKRTHHASFVICDPQVESSRWLALEDAAHRMLDAFAREHSFENLLCGVGSLVQYGLCARFLDCHSEPILLACRRLREFLCTELWGHCEALPRKIY